MQNLTLRQPVRSFFVVAILASGVAAQARDVVLEFPDGTVEERYHVDDAGRRQGLYELFRRDGTLAARAHYADDEFHGVYEEFGEDGEPRTEIHYQRGERHGRTRVFGEGGRLERVSRYRRGELHGRRELYNASGERVEVTTWKRGVLEGKFEEVSRAAGGGVRVRTGSYRDGLIDGTVKIDEGQVTVSRQVWDAGRLTTLDGIEAFPTAADVLVAKLRAIRARPEDEIASDRDPLWPRRMQSLRILQSYRALCGLPYQDMELEPEWNALCDAAAEVCRRNGGLSHNPPRPPGIDDELFRRGALGARRSNLHRGGPMESSVDSYMADSDASNIDRVGHRRWCLNPSMVKTGFGESRRFTAMWSVDRSGSGARGLDAVHYPAAGWVPVDMFRSRHAWSVSPVTGSVPDPERIEVRIVALDEVFVPVGEPLELDHLGRTPGGIGSGPALVFRPVGLKVSPGRCYLLEITEKGARQPRWRHVVGFCDPVSRPR